MVKHNGVRYVADIFYAHAMIMMTSCSDPLSYLLILTQSSFLLPPNTTGCCVVMIVICFNSSPHPPVERTTR